MRKSGTILIVAIILAGLFTTLPVLADRTWRIHSPRGGTITLVLTDEALRHFRIYDLKFLDDGDSFSITAEPSRSSQMSQSLRIGFYSGSSLVQSAYAYIGSSKATQSVYCPEDFDRIIIDY